MKNSSESRVPSIRSLSLAAFLAALATASPVCAQTPLADFQFNEGTGAITRSPTNDLTGSLGSPPNQDNYPISTTDTPSAAAGDRAVQFVNTGFLVVDDSVSPILALRTNAMTLEVWIKHDGTSPRQFEGILSYGNSYKLGLNNSELIFTLFGVVDVSSGLIVPADEWHHVAAAWEPGVGVTFYLDGQSSFIAEAGAMRAFGNNLFSIGAEGLATTILATLDRVRVHAGLLTADQLDSVAKTPKAPLANTLVAYDFNETTMPYQNAIAPARPTMVGEVYNNQLTAPRFVKDAPTGGSSDYALEFTQAGQRVFVPDPNGAIRLDNGDFTVQAWVKFGAQPQNRSVLFANNGPGGAITFSISNRNLFVTLLGIVDQPANAPIPDDGGWHHIAVVHQNGKELRFYVDGILDDTVAYTGGVLMDSRTETTFYIGAEPAGTLPYLGKLDRLSVIRGVVPAEQLDFRAVPGVDLGAPKMSVQSVVEVAWPTVPAGYKLQSTLNPADAASWTAITNTPFAAEGFFKFYAPVTASKTFYRLIKP
jgi:hypothetical protein